MTESQERRWICPECGLVEQGPFHPDPDFDGMPHPQAEPFVEAERLERAEAALREIERFEQDRINHLRAQGETIGRNPQTIAQRLIRSYFSQPDDPEGTDD